MFTNEELVQEKQPNVLRIPEWSDKLAVGQRIISPGVYTLKKLGRSKRPSLPRLRDTP